MHRQTIYEEKRIDKSFDLMLFKRLYRYTRPFLLLLTIAAVLLIAVTSVDLVRPYIIKLIIDDHLAPQRIELVRDPAGEFVYDGIHYSLGDAPSDIYVEDQTLHLEDAAHPLDDETYRAVRELHIPGVYRLAGLFLGLLVIGFLFDYLQILLLNYVGQRIIVDLRRDLYAHLQKMSLRFFERNPVGRLVTRVTNDMNNISEMYTNVIVTFLKDFLIIFGSILIMFMLDVRLSLIALSTVPLVILSSIVFRNQARKAYRLIRVKLARINATLSENISGMKVIQLFNQEARMFKEFEAINREHLEASRKEVRIFAIFRPSVRTFYSLSVALLLFYGGRSVLGGEIEFGILIAFTTYTNQFFRPIFDLTEKFNIMQAAMASLERIFLLMDEEVEIQNPELPVPAAPLRGEVEFRNVTFAYKPGEPVLKDVSFTVRPGETLAFVGATGSGKTTIMSLLTRMYDIQEGQILIDGVPITDYDKHHLRRRIGTVLQDVFLFSGDISRNISLFEEEADAQRLREVAEFVNAAPFIERLEGGYHADVAERGATLSQGQRQLLSFARVLYAEPDILILDEATSNIDTETEILIQDAIRKIIRGRTTFVVAHRLSTIRNADRIIVLHKGTIREIGSHEELIAKQGLYYNLHRLQYQ